jgi:methylated-DNA-protein-cysteine methyltransferase-like protein
VSGHFTEAVCSLLSEVPPGRVVTYGALAAAAGSPRGARQVVRILHTQSRVRGLPWQRVLAAGGRIAFSDPGAAALQKELLRSECVETDSRGCVDLSLYGWDFSAG